MNKQTKKEVEILSPSIFKEGEMKNYNRDVFAGKPLFIYLVIVALITVTLIITYLNRTPITTAISIPAGPHQSSRDPTPIQLAAILHYATSTVVPQQSRAEIKVTFNVLKKIAPCNFLVFGLGHDSLMWSSFNPGGTTLFLEEDFRWFQRILSDAPSLRAHAVRYYTRLSEANSLLFSYKLEPSCLPPGVYLKGNTLCKLALSRLPEEVYDKEWDVIMVDGPKGYFAEAPGRMGAIFSAAVMARARVRPGVTHVILHDVNRKVEKTFAKEFLCKKYLVKAVGRLWHFEVPPAANVSSGSSGTFC